MLDRGEELPRKSTQEQVQSFIIPNYTALANLLTTIDSEWQDDSLDEAHDSEQSESEDDDVVEEYCTEDFMSSESEAAGIAVAIASETERDRIVVRLPTECVGYYLASFDSKNV